MSNVNVIARLRESKARHQASLEAQGKIAGEKWAKESAETVHLERLEKTRDGNCNWHFDEGSCAYSSGELFRFIIEPEDDGSRESARDFWEQELGEGFDELMHDDAFVRGFAIAAMDVWVEVQDQI